MYRVYYCCCLLFIATITAAAVVLIYIFLLLFIPQSVRIHLLAISSRLSVGGRPLFFFFLRFKSNLLLYAYNIQRYLCTRQPYSNKVGSAPRPHNIIYNIIIVTGLNVTAAISSVCTYMYAIFPRKGQEPAGVPGYLDFGFTMNGPGEIHRGRFLYGRRRFRMQNRQRRLHRSAYTVW